MSDTTTIVVAHGRSVCVGNRLYGPGEQVAVSVADAEHLEANGFVHDPKGQVVNRLVMRRADHAGNIGLQQQAGP